MENQNLLVTVGNKVAKPRDTASSNGHSNSSFGSSLAAEPGLSRYKIILV